MKVPRCYDDGRSVGRGEWLPFDSRESCVQVSAVFPTWWATNLVPFARGPESIIGSVIQFEEFEGG